MISRSKMSDYAQSIIFSEPDLHCSLDRQSAFNFYFIRPFRLMSKLPYNYGLRFISYLESRFSLGERSYSYNEYNRALDDLVTKRYNFLSWRSNDTYKIGLDTYSSISYNKKCKFMNPRNMWVLNNDIWY